MCDYIYNVLRREREERERKRESGGRERRRLRERRKKGEGYFRELKKVKKMEFGQELEYFSRLIFNCVVRIFYKSLTSNMACASFNIAIYIWTETFKFS